MSDGLTTWVIYDHPADFPHHVVVRPWVVTAGHVNPNPPQLFADVEQARAWLEPLGLYRMDRQPDDDPTIVEVWI